MTQADREHLERALSLAEKGRGLTSPNPIVGAVVVRDGRVMGEGFHAGAGEDHAEIVAMKDAVGPDFAGRLRGASVFVTLEPCAHYGRTPPCTDALIAAGVARVVVAATDPSARVNGRGLEKLLGAGVEVDLAEGDLAYRARRQNDPFRKHASLGLPFVTYKFAMTLDGRVAAKSGDSQWISGEESRLFVQQLRAWSDVVLVGAGTLRLDDPRLTVRDVAVRRQPLRVVVDSQLGVKETAALIKTAGEGPVLLVCGSRVPSARRKEVESWGVEVACLPPGAGGYPEPLDVARLLAGRDIHSILLEGGPTFAAAWWDAGLVDRVLAFVAPVVVGGSQAPGPLPTVGLTRMADALRLRDVEGRASGDDFLISGYLRGPY